MFQIFTFQFDIYSTWVTACKTKTCNRNMITITPVFLPYTVTKSLRNLASKISGFFFTVSSDFVTKQAENVNVTRILFAIFTAQNYLSCKDWSSAQYMTNNSGDKVQHSFPFLLMRVFDIFRLKTSSFYTYCYVGCF